jgi:hypothetical protein
MYNLIIKIKDQADGGWSERLQSFDTLRDAARTINSTHMFANDLGLQCGADYEVTLKIDD